MSNMVVSQHHVLTLIGEARQIEMSCILGCQPDVVMEQEETEAGYVDIKESDMRELPEQWAKFISKRQESPLNLKKRKVR